jgi:hypothetical protein
MAQKTQMDMVFPADVVTIEDQAVDEREPSENGHEGIATNGTKDTNRYGLSR